MNKKIVIGVFLVSVLGSYLLFSLIFQEQTSNEQEMFNNRLDEVYDEVEEEYDGAMIVRYNTSTGEIISKRKGAITFTEEEAEGKIIITKQNLSPSEAISTIIK